MKNILIKLFYLFFPLFLGTIVSISISPNIEYVTLLKPTLSPPSFLFPVVWTIIYLLMGISFFLLKRNTSRNKKESIIYYLQLFVNILWSIIFFNLNWKFFSIIWIILLDVLVIYMIILFYKKYKLSAYLNILYLIWILFATYLTIGIYILN